MINCYKRFSNEAAKALPKLKPTDKQTIKPGPAVEATASISSIFLPLSLIAFELSIYFSMWDRAASSVPLHQILYVHLPDLKLY